MATLRAGGCSDRGPVRRTNEDALFKDESLGLLIVADGMGGHAAGEVASRTAADEIEQFIEETREWHAAADWPFPYDGSQPVNGNRLRMAFHLANQRLARAAASDGSLRGMATTASAVLAGQASLVIGHVGDSRVYLWRDAALRQLTVDHSWVGERVRAGIMSESDARQHPWRNVVTRALSGGSDPEVDTVELTPAKGERLLLCSDGLSGVVPHETIGRILGQQESLEIICERLIAAANEGGGPDNITVLVLEIADPDAP